MSVEVDVTNTGEVEGREVVQLYVAPHKGVILRPIKELKGFTKVNLKPNETKTVTFALDKRSFAYWNLELNDWHVEDGNYDIVIGKNVHDDVLKQTLSVRGITIFVGKLTELSTIGDVILNPKGAAYWEKIQPRVIEGAKQKGFTSETDVENESDHRTEVMFSLPINTLCFIIPDYTIDELNTALEEINKDDWRIY
ncbi:fibronectin type III-like domain-contianing protein [Paenibacillus sp. UASWS1643]|uniref:fibronectin type III-like domain-contianing protein n=1 Tax=Paenibacillus sp. UASWS1643 TaxID=2580422 RepID=UPI0021E0EB9B|nr:fibronectin type III-like domain-contianing protein [Paenibacillus sp. UASWS1643]